jgi:thiol-disulfide isomerase/thioredoxin
VCCFRGSGLVNSSVFSGFSAPGKGACQAPTATARDLASPVPCSHRHRGEVSTGVDPDGRSIRLIGDRVAIDKPSQIPKLFRMIPPARPDQALRRILRARFPRPSGPLSLIALLLLLVAAGLATGMARSAWSGAAVAGCAGDGCAEVAASDYDWVAGAPVALWGALAYLWAAGALILRRGRLLQGMAGLVAGAALWFVAVQAFVLGVWCPACLSLHGLALAGVGLALLASPRVTERPAPRRAVLRFGGLSGRGAVGAGLALGFVAPGVLPADRPEVKVETVALTPREGARALVGGGQLFEGAFELKRGDYPLYGDPAADRISVLLWDPLCPYCREMQPLLIEAGEALATSGTAILSLPVSTSASSEAWARDLMAAWIADPAGYPALAAALTGTEETETALASADPGVREAWFARVRGEAGEKTASESSDEKAGERLTLARRLLLAAWERADQAVVPVLISGDGLHLGGFGSSAGIVAAVAPGEGLVVGDFKDPCDPRGRAFCGRLIISMIAAGEEPFSQSKLHRHLADDIFEYNAFNHLKQFSQTGGALPVNALGFSSDDGFNAKATALFEGSKNGKCMGTHLMSADTFQQVLGVSSQKSYLQEAIAEFEQNPECIKLKEENGQILLFHF